MNAKKFIVGSIAALGFYAIVKASQKTLVAATAKFQVKRVRVDGLNVIVTLAVLNPMSETITLKSFVGVLLSGVDEVAKLKNFTPVKINANSETSMDITFVPVALGLVSLLRTIVTKGFGNMGLRIVGTANVNDFALPVNISF